MGNLIKKLIEAGRTDALNSTEEFLTAARELGYSEEEVRTAMEDLDGFPLDDEQLDEIAGGLVPFDQSNIGCHTPEVL